MRQPYRRALSLAVAAMLVSGCASTVRLVGNPTPEYEAIADGTPGKQGTPLVLVRKAPAAAALGVQDLGWYLATGFVASNVMLAANKFQDPTAGYQWAGLAAGLAVGVDFVANMTYGAGRRPIDGPRYFISDRLPTRVAVDRAGLDQVSLRVPPVEADAGTPIALDLLDANGNRVGRATWLVPQAATVAVQGKPKPQLGPSPVAARAAAPKPAATSAPAKHAATSAPAKPTAAEPATARPTAAPARPAAAALAVPPKLTTKVALEEPVGDGAVHAGEGGTLVVTVANEGTTHAFGVIAHLKLEAAVLGLAVPPVVPVGDVAPGATQVVRVPLGAERGLRPARANVNVVVEDINRFDAPPARLAFDVRAYEAVRLVVDQVGVTNAAGESIPRRGEQVDLKVLIKNPGKIAARGVVAELQRRHADLIAAGTERVEVGEIPAGGWKIAHFTLFVRNSYNGPTTLPLAVKLRESRGEANQDAPITVALDKSAPTVVEYAAATKPAQAAEAPEAPDLTVDVDQPVKRQGRKDPDAVALVIGIERYGSQVPAVAYAQRDAQAMKRYMRDVLGVEEENVITLLNDGATKGAMTVAIEAKLKNLVVPGKSNVYVFYAGHGAPDPATKSAFLVPFDGDPSYPTESCYAATRLYEKLGALSAKRVTVMLDACFTGQDGRGKEPQLLLAGARPLMIEALAPAVPANVTVFAAAGPSQISSAYPEKRHGLFTYFLLKGLRGEELPAEGLTVRKLQGYLADQVSRRARRMNREQLPQLIDQQAEDRPLRD